MPRAVRGSRGRVCCASTLCGTVCEAGGRAGQMRRSAAEGLNRAVAGAALRARTAGLTCWPAHLAVLWPLPQVVQVEG